MIRKTTDLQSHAIRSPVVMGIAGAILGTVAARIIRGATAGRRKERIEWQPEGGAGWAAGAEGYDDEQVGASERTAGLKERAEKLKEDARERASDLKQRAAGMVDDMRERAADVRDRLPSGAELRGRANDAYRFATDEQPALGGVLAMAAGMALGFLLPVTEREERVIRPIQERAADNLGQLDDKVRRLADKLDDKIAGGAAEGDQDAAEERPPGATQSRPFPSA